jgi:hypothetical protein
MNLNYPLMAHAGRSWYISESIRDYLLPLLFSFKMRLISTSFHNVGSIYIPCEAEPGLKNMCTLYRYNIYPTSIILNDNNGFIQ